MREYYTLEELVQLERYADLLRESQAERLIREATTIMPPHWKLARAIGCLLIRMGQRLVHAVPTKAYGGRERLWA